MEKEYLIKYQLGIENPKYGNFRLTAKPHEISKLADEKVSEICANDTDSNSWIYSFKTSPMEKVYFAEFRSSISTAEDIVNEVLSFENIENYKTLKEKAEKAEQALNDLYFELQVLSE